MNQRSTKRKLNQTLGMVKVLVPAFVAMWIWQSSIKPSVQDIWLISSPARTELFGDESTHTSIYLLGDVEFFELRIFDNEGNEFSEIDTVKITQTKKHLVVQNLNWKQTGNYKVTTQANYTIPNSNNLITEKDTFDIRVKPRKPEILGLSYLIHQGQVDSLPISIERVNRFAEWALEDTLLSADHNHSILYKGKRLKQLKKEDGNPFLQKRESLIVSTGMDTGFFQLHGKPPQGHLNSTPEVLYRFRVIPNNPPEIRSTIDTTKPMFEIGGSSPFQPPIWAEFHAYIEDPDGHPLDPHPGIIKFEIPGSMSRHEKTNAERILQTIKIDNQEFRIPSGLPKGDYIIIFSFKYCGNLTEKIPIKFRQL